MTTGTFSVLLTVSVGVETVSEDEEEGEVVVTVVFSTEVTGASGSSVSPLRTFSISSSKSKIPLSSESRAVFFISSESRL